MSNPQNTTFAQSASGLLDEVMGLPGARAAAVDLAFVRPGARELYAADNQDFLAPATSQSAI